MSSLIQSNICKLNAEEETVKYISKGHGEPILFLHGFPDHPQTFAAQFDFFSEQGYQVIAPYMRGYYKEGYNEKKPITALQLGVDLLDFIAALQLEKVHVVAHDWGCAAAYTAVRIEPSLFSSLTCMSVPYGNALYDELCKNTVQQKQSWYYFLLNSSVAATAIAHDNFNMIDVLWNDWTNEDILTQEELERIKDIFKDNYKYTVSYYKNAFAANFSLQLLPYLKKMSKEVAVPFLLIHGEDDACILWQTVEKNLSYTIFTKMNFVKVKNANHFPHREQSMLVNQEILVNLQIK
ncbi:alpha/beta fold hydrolase [Kordia jejudonensis]|uniref:alpha/beta fold hydrolase n=1 Tax=Kordia jejudonensis TaxID=1348245 RepID=UPI0006291206|nr:alpha/beta hydrolase [Kordia jejudonensis]